MLREMVLATLPYYHNGSKCASIIWTTPMHWVVALLYPTPH